MAIYPGKWLISCRNCSERLREIYEEKWNDIGLFVKFGAISDEKFYEKAKGFLLLTTEKNILLLEEYQAKVKDFSNRQDGSLVYLYTVDDERQHSYVVAANKRDYDLLMNTRSTRILFITWKRNWKNPPETGGCGHP